MGPMDDAAFMAPFVLAVKLNSTMSDVDKPYQDCIIALAEFLKKKVKALSYTAAPGFSDDEARLTANLIADVLDNPRDAANIDAVRAKVHSLTSRFPVYR